MEVYSRGFGLWKLLVRSTSAPQEYGQEGEDMYWDGDRGVRELYFLYPVVSIGTGDYVALLNDRTSLQPLLQKISVTEVKVAEGCGEC